MRYRHQHRSLIRATARASARGFTLIELLTVVAILGIMATLALVGYTKNVRNARRTEVIGDLSNLALRENAMMSARGHYASTASTEDDTYPVAPVQLQNEEGAIQWDITQPGYTSDAVAVGTPYFQAGGLEHGFDVMNFLPEGGHSWCAYGVISGDGTNGEFGDEPPGEALGAEVFPAGDLQLQRFYARDWFYAFAKCDFDHDGTFWEFTTAHFTTDVSMGDTNYGE
ncbi:MAG TPA: prepilin-type N-terminal cleavage/methylation domain-containing protein [Enhygromyxa sp.]|nr:prepilin-type N-terminal cleavage/methylation domain-containing protein [Enhygromyxa sp.]